MDKQYRKRRQEFEKRFRTYKPVPGSEVVELSPSGQFELTKTQYSAGPATWGFSRGIVVDTESRTVIADIKRNFGAFWHAWVEHPNSNEYLLCGEDYQGQTVINLSKKETHTYFPEKGHDGRGFCWAQVFPSPDGLMLAVDGCYWACPYDLVFFDFRTPDMLPFDELGRTGSLTDSGGWKDNNSFVLTREIEIRKADGAPYESLSDAEQNRLDSDASLTDYKTERIEVTRPLLMATKKQQKDIHKN